MIAKPRPKCAGEPEKNEPFAATLLVCANGDPHAPVTPDQSKRCKPTEPRKLSIEEPQGTLVYENIPTGTHFLRVTGRSESDSRAATARTPRRTHRSPDR